MRLRASLRNDEYQREKHSRGQLVVASGQSSSSHTQQSIRPIGADGNPKAVTSLDNRGHVVQRFDLVGGLCTPYDSTCQRVALARLELRS
jgi:hypothetical protein